MWNPFSKNSKSTRAAQAAAQAATQLHLKIAEIRDGTLILKNGGLREILRCSCLNFNLKSEEEQNSIIYSYQAFLNTLEFPIQIVIRSKKLDLDHYLDNLKKLGEKQTNTLLQRQTFDYIDYIRRLIEYADIMEKEFYVVVPMDPTRTEGKNFVAKFWERMHPADSVSGILQRHAEFDKLKKTLQQRVNVITSGIENCGIKVESLTTEEIISLFYQQYNPLTARNQKIEDASQFQVASDASLGRP